MTPINLQSRVRERQDEGTSSMPANKKPTPQAQTDPVMGPLNAKPMAPVAAQQAVDKETVQWRTPGVAPDGSIRYPIGSDMQEGDVV